MYDLDELLKRAYAGESLTYGEWQALEREGYAEGQTLTRTGRRAALNLRTR